jgi:dTDP-4-dehydrorhamnose 3,5-epimerase
MYLCSAPYNPAREHGIHPLDAEVGLVFPDGLEPLLSPKDESAPSLAEALEQGLLPSYAACQEWYGTLS